MVLRATTSPTLRRSRCQKRRNRADGQQLDGQVAMIWDHQSSHGSPHQRRRAQGRPMAGPRRTACLQPRPRSARPHLPSRGRHAAPAPGARPPRRAETSYVNRADLTCGGPACGTSTPAGERHTRKAMKHWPGYGGAGWCPVSRLADHTGQPPVIVKMNAHVACAMTAASTNTTSASPAAKPRQHRAGR
jgi:hypothetical protein